jgi:hypothetical protein
LCESIGYAHFKGIPLQFRITDLSSSNKAQKEHREELLQAAFLMTSRNFPAFDFFPLYEAGITFRNDEIPSLPALLSRAKRILNGTKTVPLLYNPYKHDFSNSNEAHKEIMRIRSMPEYVDLFHCKKFPFSKQVEQWSQSFQFSDHKVSALAVKRYYNMFLRSPRFIHIALHYFVTASRLIHNHFIEDAGLNLQLTVEAVIRDFMDFRSIRNKRTAAKSFKESVLLPYGHMEFLDELYDARNMFLAHIDEDMYTDNQSIDDPDAYCYEHYESVSWLITRYIRYKNRIKKDDGRLG